MKGFCGATVLLLLGSVASAQWSPYTSGNCTGGQCTVPGATWAYQKPVARSPSPAAAVTPPALPGPAATPSTVPFYASTELLAYVRRTVCRICNDVPGDKNYNFGTTIIVGIKEEPKAVYDIALCYTANHLFFNGVGKIAIEHSDGYSVEGKLVEQDVENDLAAVVFSINKNSPLAIIAENPPVRPATGSLYLATHGYAFTNYYARAGKLDGYQKGLPNAPPEAMCVMGVAYQGDSGGGVFDDSGSLVGVVTSSDLTTGRVVANTCLTLHKFTRKVQQKLPWAGDSYYMNPSPKAAVAGLRCTRPRGPLVAVNPPAVVTPPVASTAVTPPALPGKVTAKPADPPAAKDTAHDDILAQLGKMDKKLDKLQQGQDATTSQLQKLTEKSGELTLVVDAPRFIEPTYVDVSVIWAMQQKYGIEHAVLVVDSRLASWKSLQVTYQNAKAKFPLVTLVDVASKNVKISPLPQMVLYGTDKKSAPFVMHEGAKIAAKLQELASP